jgi:hypothetical protein
MSTAASATNLQRVQKKVEEQTSCWTSGSAIVLYIAVAKLIVQLLTAPRYGFNVDELYFLACSEHLDWGYVDQPPLIALIALVARHSLGESLLALRFIPALAGALLLWLTGCITREIGGGRFAQGLSAIAVLVSPAYLFVHHLLTMNAFEPALWAGCVYFAVRGIGRDAPVNWLWAGALAGLGLENKYTIAMLLLGLLVGLIFTSARKWLGVWQFWAAGALAMLIFAPNLIWEIVHHFPFLEWQRYIRANPRVQTFNFSVSDFLLDQVLLTLPVFALWIIGLWFFLVSAQGKRFRFLGVAILVVLGICLRSGKPYYAIPIYAIAFTGGAIAVEGFTNVSNRRWLRSIFVIIIVAIGAILAPCFIPILPIERFVQYQRSLHLPLPIRSEFYESQSELPGYLAWEFGWDEMVAAVAQVYKALPEEEQSKTGIIAAGYGEAGAIDLLGKKYGLPKAISGQLAYYDFGPRNYTGEVMILVGHFPPRACRSFQFGATLENRYGYDGQRGPIINVCRDFGFDFGMGLQRMWPLLKHY